jgi:hypothetical protein
MGRYTIRPMSKRPRSATPDDTARCNASRSRTSARDRMARRPVFSIRTVVSSRSAWVAIVYDVVSTSASESTRMMSAPSSARRMARERP